MHPDGIQLVDVTGTTYAFWPYCQFIQFKAIDSHGDTMGSLEMDVINVGHFIFECLSSFPIRTTTLTMLLQTSML